MKRTTISISESVKKELLREMSKLQLKWGKRVDFEDIIWFLIMQNRKKPELLEEACKPIEGISAETVIKELIRERRTELAKEEKTQRIER